MELDTDRNFVTGSCVTQFEMIWKFQISTRFGPGTKLEINRSHPKDSRGEVRLKMGKSQFHHFIVVSLIVLINCPSSWAGLGEYVTSVESDTAKLSSLKSRHSVSAIRPLYTVHEIRYALTTLREYVSTSGIVFGMAWSGYNHPDIESLLAGYSNEYQIAVAAETRTVGERRHTTHAERVIVETWGHMRKLQGRIYDPALLPTGVSVDELR